VAHDPPVRRTRAIALAAVLALAAAACGGEADEPPAPRGAPTTAAPDDLQAGGTIVYGADQEPTGFNPNTSKDNGTAVQNVVANVWPSTFEALPDFTVHLNEDLLESAELAGTDPQTVVYRIRDEAVWSDGTPISADDFVYNWEHQNGSDPDVDVASVSGYDRIESVVGSDGGKTVTVTFAEPYSEWQSLFWNILPAHYTEAQDGGWNTGLDAAPTISGGPYVIDDYEPGADLTLLRNEAWWGEPARLDAIVFRFIPDSPAQGDALRNGEVDMIYPQPQLDLVQQLEELDDVTSEVNFGLQFEHLTFNLENEFLAMPEVRRAIALGVDREQLVAATVGQFDDEASQLDNRMWLTNQPEYEAHGEDYASADVDGARALLEEAGFVEGDGGTYELDGRPLSLRISTTAGNALRESQEEVVQAQLAEVGIDIRIENAPSDVLFGEWGPEGNFDIINFAWVGSPFTISGNESVYRSGSANNWGHYANPEVDDLFATALTELDPEEAAALGNRIDEVLWEDLTNLPLYQKPTFIAYRTTFANIGDNSTSSGPFWNAETWGLRP
jgi:peptide/nickel transport system substrate-binding protein